MSANSGLLLSCGDYVIDKLSSYLLWSDFSSLSTASDREKASIALRWGKRYSIVYVLVLSPDSVKLFFIAFSQPQEHIDVQYHVRKFMLLFRDIISELLVVISVIDNGW